jgi:hypothetical protein
MYGRIPNHPEHEMKKPSALQGTFFALGLALAGCLQTDPAGNPDQARPDIQDPDLVAGATSSTNWPAEDAGTQPIQIFGTADSTLSFTFKAPPAKGQVPTQTPFAGTIRFYRAGTIPVLDSLSGMELSIPLTDTVKIPPDLLNPLIRNEMDTLKFTAEFSTGNSVGILTGFSYSRKEGKFIAWPTTINTGNSVPMSEWHYKFASIPDSAFRAILSDTTGNARFYYYIPGTPYFWRHDLVRDSLYIGPTVKANLPLRFIKVMSHAGMNPDFTIEVYPLSLAKESVNDSIHHFEPVERFKLGDLIYRRSGQGTLDLREP